MSNFTPSQLAGLEALEVLKRIYTGLEADYRSYQLAIDVLEQSQSDLDTTQTDLENRVFGVLGCVCYLTGEECGHKQPLSPERQIGPAAHARTTVTSADIDKMLSFAFADSREEFPGE